MKILIAYLLAATSLMADLVQFRWSPNSEPDIGGYVLYIGQTRADSEMFRLSKDATTAIVFMQPHERAWLCAVTTAGGWSDPAGPLEYKPVVVELVIQSTRLGPAIPWATSELFRIEESIFDPASANQRTKLLITRQQLRVEFLDDHFIPRSYFLNTGTGNEFFRSYVAFRPL